ncbi:MAG: PQQ-binding-like beta-propeller repeat protein [Candidatus Promineifilaceae bacterium]
MNALIRLVRRPIFLLLILSALLLSACGSRVASVNWPGLSTDGEKLYLANGPTVSVYNADDQTLAWQYPTPEEANGRVSFYAAPSVQDNRVVFGDYGAAGGILSPKVTVSVYARENIDNGGTPPETPGWTASEVAFDKIVAPPLQVGDVVYVGTADNLVLALNATNGELIWQFEAGHSIWGQPAYKGGKLYVASLDRSLHALDAQTGEELWETEFEGAIASRPVLNESLVYIGEFGSQVHAVDAETGSIVWSAPAENWVWGAPAYDGGAVYYADIDGNVYAVDAQTGESRWQAQAAGAVQTSPLVVDGVVYVASEGESSEDQVSAGELSAFNASNGERLWRQVTPAPLFTAPVNVENAVVVAMQSESAVLSAYDLKSGAPLWNIAPPSQG